MSQYFCSANREPEGIAFIPDDAWLLQFNRNLSESLKIERLVNQGLKKEIAPLRRLALRMSKAKTIREAREIYNRSKGGGK